MIIGDFNGDIYRLKYANDINLNNFINKMNLQAATSDLVKSDYTYYKGENKSCITYALIKKENKMKYIFRIDYDKYNTTDHFALQIEINLDKNETSKSIRQEECNKKTNGINWKNMDIVEEYSKKANYELRKVRFNNAWGPNQNVQNDLDEYYNKITEAIITANNHTINQVYANKKMNNKTGKPCFAELHFAETPKLVLGLISPN